jgi:NAD(P)-dependent dehydrogenase (short-subunit alcohol dehydrogenase family)
MSRLAGKVALITGGASGMGAATVRRFIAEGAQTHFSDVQANLGEALAAETGAWFHHHDVSDDTQWQRVMQAIAQRHGRLDILMNNAGILGPASIEELDLASWARVIAVNQTGVMLGCQHGIRLMRRNPAGPAGSLINTCSTSAFAALPHDVAYTATKGAVRSLTKAVAVHCARAGTAIRCNAIVPGAIDTPILHPAAAVIPDLHKIAAAMSPFNRMGTGADIAAMAVFLGSDESTFCTGAEFLVDGGALAGHPGM